ncbi:nuclear transport factor 2 family protein [Lichenihabitans sp. PAMC28606]|uniref:nuclear transport factor 2 family protein n=1 Tax=Lichenihabitans sp. PAMC28606 TaxID=2880932 RepID=UPI001D0BB879|nr:nuclear transport factor 2 family protein [Lichenihabitans sp. PAMC28606]UDL94417.1 nuclear transport factor 2 family protein [Lichenihabitans sp. PAMC28606]
MSDPNPIYSAYLREVLGARLHPNAHSYVEMLAEDGVVEFPYAIPGLPQRVEGRAALAAHLDRIAGLIEFSHFADTVKHETSDPEVVIIEFSGHGRSAASGEPYGQRYVSIVTTRGGYIVHYKDYWNPVAALRTLRGQAFVESLMPKV